MASDAGRVGSLGETVYSAAKGGLIAFTKSLARETARYGINVNVVCPGPTDTPLMAAVPDKVKATTKNVDAELALQAGGDLEDAPLALDLAKLLAARDVRDVLAEQDDARVACHLVPHARVQQVHHRGGVPAELRIVLGVERLAGRVDIGRVDGKVHRTGVGLRLA